VFVSSTLGELAEERAAARGAVEQLLLTPVMFELGARPHAPQALYRAYLRQSHVFVGLYWQKYGWVAPEESISGLEDEYQRSGGLPRLLYVKEPAPRRQDRLTQLLDRMKLDASYKKFATPDELARLLSSDLMLLLTEKFEESAAMSSQRSDVELRLTPPPLPLTAILGRDAEMAAVARLISSGTRLVTVTGMGGVGKTRLVAEVARRLIPDMPDDVHFVALATVRDSDSVLPAVSESLGIPREGGRGAVASLADYLGERRLLLVLDNFEHVPAAAPALASLLDRCPGLQALVTSQHTLGIRGESEFALEPLPVPGGGATASAADSPAVQLFAERAAAARPGFALTSDNLAAIIEICRRLDGLPLAIELAAARVRLLPPSALLGRLERRLDLLATDSAEVPERQRTLRATVDWSYHLLTRPEQRLFGRLSVFADGCTLEAAERVCGGDLDVISTITSLLEKSLLVVANPDSGSEPRLRMLGTVREYALERLGSGDEETKLRQRHSEYFLRLVAENEALSRGPAHRPWFEQLDAEAGNLQAAAECLAAQGDWNGVAEFGSATAIYYWVRGNTRHVSDMLWQAYPHLDNISALNREYLLANLASLAWIEGDSDQAARLAEEAASALESADDNAAVLVLQILSYIGVQKGNFAEVARLTAQMSTRAHASGEPWNVMQSGMLESLTAMLRGDLDFAWDRLSASLEISRQLGHWPFTGIILRDLGLIELRRDNPAGARPLLVEAGELERRAHFREGLADTLELLAAVALAAGNVRLAARTLASVDATRRLLGVRHWNPTRQFNETLQSQINAQLGRGFATEWAEGAKLSAYAAFDHVIVALQPGNLFRSAGSGYGRWGQRRPRTAAANVALRQLPGVVGQLPQDDFPQSPPPRQRTASNLLCHQRAGAGTSADIRCRSAAERSRPCRARD
jgi:predicted ATPase